MYVYIFNLSHRVPPVWHFAVPEVQFLLYVTYHTGGILCDMFMSHEMVVNGEVVNGGDDVGSVSFVTHRVISSCISYAYNAENETCITCITIPWMTCPQLTWSVTHDGLYVCGDLMVITCCHLPVTGLPYSLWIRMCHTSLVYKTQSSHGTRCIHEQSPWCDLQYNNFTMFYKSCDVHSQNVSKIVKSSHSNPFH